MSFLVYQRADPRFPEWHALQTQQMRLRNLIQVIGINLDAGKNANLFYTLHMSTSDTFFYSSEIHSTGAVVSWKKIDPGAIPSEIRLSADGFVIRIWSSCDGDKPITSWGVHLKSLCYIGTKGDWSSQDFLPYSLVFRMPYGYFTARSCMQTNIHDNSWIPFGLLKSPEAVRSSYTLANLALLHDVQRSVLEEVTVSRRLRLRINNSGYSCYMGPATTTKSLAPLSRNAHGDNFSVVKIEQQSQNSLRYQQGAVKIKLKQDIEILRLVVTLLRNEKARFEGRVLRLKQKAKSCDESDLMSRIHSLGRERDRLANVKSCIHKKMLKLAEQRSALYLRRKQLISELSVIYPLQLVEGSKRYSIAEVQLPNAEDYGSETGGQVSVALGYTAHLVAMLCFFLGIPLRYPVLHFGSRSRIVDHITMQIPNKEREFPLYFRGREDVYSKYAVYLLNKNVAQLRWYCGLSTSDLRATLPNVYNVLTSRLTIPGWPPILCDNCEIAEELTEETHHQMFRGDLSLSLDGGLDQLSSTTNSFDEARMQSWFAASHSDLDGAGNNWVPAGELNHGRGQTRFLSGWKKKTYSDSEEIDPVWLTNSLNLELDFGGRGVTSTPSPPLRLPHISISEAKADEFVRRKRRHGRVETQNPSCDYTASLRTPDSRIHPTPNLNMDDVEKRIIANERRKSVCDPARIRSAMNLIKAHENFPLQQNEICDSTVPLVDNYLTTDDEKTDSIIADVVRRMSVVDFQNFKTDRPVSSSGPLVEDLSQDAETLSPLGSSRPSTPGIQHIDRPEQDDGQLNQVIINDEKIDRDSSSVGSSYKLDNTTGIPTSSLQTQTASHSETSDVQCKDNLDAKERNVNLCEYSLDSRNNFSNEEGTCGQNSVIASVESTTADEKGEGCRVQDTLNPDSDVVSSINGTINQDSPSIWHRTEALVNATSFNRLKRRMSEST